MKRSHSPENAVTTFTAPSKIQQKVIYRNYFPSDVLKYMKLNAKPRMSVKLMEVCKYFKFYKFPFFVVKSIIHALGEWTYVTLDDKIISTSDLSKIPENLWITEKITICIRKVNFAAFLKKIDVSDAPLIRFVSQTIPFSKLKPFCANVKHFTSITNKLKDDEGNDISLEDMFESLPNLEYLFLTYYCPSIKSLEHVNRVIPPNLKVFRLECFIAKFKLGKFADFMIQHQNIKYSIKSNLSYTVTYKNQLRRHVARIIREWNYQNLPPMIDYSGQHPTTRSKLQVLHERHILAMHHGDE